LLILFSLKVLSLQLIFAQWLWAHSGLAYMSAQRPLLSCLIKLVHHARNPQNIGVDKISAPT
jgi:hypothetical protein